MPSHRNATVLLLPALMAGGAIGGIASAQATFEFTDSGQALGNSSSFSVALGDLDGDGDLDAMVSNINQPNTVWTNGGTGTFTNSGQTLGNGFSTSVALGDLDGDGNLDAVIANTNEFTTQSNTVWTNDGTGTFTNSGQTLGNDFSAAIALGDLDGDGNLDAMLANFNGEPNTVWTNTVTGTGVCCAPSGCMLMTENLSGLCEGLGGTFLAQGSCDDCLTNCPGDIDGDGEVGPQDLALLLGYWGVCP